jgi:hypothetical protein
MSNWLDKENVEEVNFYLTLIVAFDKKLMQLALAPDSTKDYRYDLISLLHNAYVSADKAGKKFISSIEGLSELLLQTL